MDSESSAPLGHESVSGESADERLRADEDSQPGQSEETVRLARQLTPKQRIVVQALGEGCSAPEAARRAKVHPSTVNRWLNHNARFIAAHNAWITETIKIGRAAVVSLIPLAAQAVRDALEAGNGWLALQVLRDAKLTTLPDAGAITPKAVRQQMQAEKQQREAELLQMDVRMKQQHQEIEKLQEEIEHYRQKKMLETDKHTGYFEAWAEFWAQWESERSWQAQHAEWRKKKFDEELETIQREREIQRVREEASRSTQPAKPYTSEWTHRLEQERRDAQLDMELLKAIKANPDGIAATGIKLPPGVHWPKGWPNVPDAERNNPDSPAPSEPAKGESGAKDTTKSNASGPTSRESPKLQT